MKKLWYICTIKYYLAINRVQCHGCTSCSGENKDTKEIHTVWFYLLKVQKEAKQYFVVERKIVVTWYGLERERNFWGDDQTQYHDLGSGYISIYDHFSNFLVSGPVYTLEIYCGHQRSFLLALVTFINIYDID